MKCLLLGTSVVLLAGCSGLASLMNREIQENEITVGDESRKKGALQASVLGMSENRRGILIRDNRRLSSGMPSLYFCAEPPPDVAMSTRAGLAAGVAKAGVGEGKFTDEYTRVAMALANRTSLLDIYRTAVFSLCQMHMNGAIQNASAEALFRDITLKAIERAPSSETPHAAASGTLPAPIPGVTLQGAWVVTPPASGSTQQAATEGTRPAASAETAVLR